MEKETIEEFALRNSKYTNHSNINTQKQEAIILGAKWQAERMYSEEDMHKAYCAGSDFDMSCLKDEQYYMFKKWFEQFKKK